MNMTDTVPMLVNPEISMCQYRQENSPKQYKVVSTLVGAEKIIQNPQHWRLDE